MGKLIPRTAGLLAILCLAACSRSTSPPRTADLPPLAPVENLPPLAPAEKLPDTDVLPYTGGPITQGRNYLYCGTFQLAWNEMQQQIVKAPIQLEGNPPMADFLNKGPFQKSDLSAESFLAMAGSVDKGIVEEIRQAMAEKFPSAAMEAPEPLEDTAFYAYAYLEKALAFREAFDRLPEPLPFHSGGKEFPVAGFGFRDLEVSSERDEQIEKQATILDYRGDDDFILALNTTSERDQIVLAKIPPQKTLQETIAAVQARIEQSPLEEWNRGVHASESLVVPIISVGVERRYAELIGRHLRNRGWELYSVSEARQGIRFRLDEYGARLESDSVLGLKSAMPAKPRQFVFDRPFLIYLKEQSSQRSYFALWVETPEVLQQVEH
jgi:hypothetical protein